MDADAPDFGADNKIFTREEMEKAVAEVRELLAQPHRILIGDRPATVLTTAELVERLNEAGAERTHDLVAPEASVGEHSGHGGVHCAVAAV